MPRMPTADQLSDSLPSSRSIPRERRDFLGPAISRVGQTISSEAERDRDLAVSVKRKENAERDSLDLSRARADWQTRRANESENYKFENDQDYGTWKTRFEKNIFKHRDQSATLITSPKLRQKFEAETQADIAESSIQIGNRASGIDRGKRKAEGINSVEQMVSLAATKPKAEADKLIAQARANVDNMTFAGVMEPEEAVGVRQRVIESYASAKARQDVQDNPALAQRWLDGEGGQRGAIIKEAEGFRSTPYDDGGVLRVGYGSDTITLADGTPVKVRAGMRVSRADAQRDLDRRMAEYEGDIVKKIGVDAWAKHTPETQEVLRSIAHNYGTIPETVAMAAKSGDPIVLAEAIRARADDKANGVQGGNAKRRMIEAAIVEGSMEGPPITPDYYEFLPVGERVQLKASAEAEVARQDKERNDKDDLDRFVMDSAIDDDVKQIANTGVPADIDPTNVANTLGPTAAAKWLDRRQTAAETYAEVSKLDNMTDNEISEHLDMIEPKAGTANFERAQTVYDAVERRAKKLTDLRLKDPAMSVEDSAIVKKALDGYRADSPASNQTLVRSRYAAQQAVGIPSAMQQPVTRAEARKIIAPIQSTIDLMDASIVAAIGENGGNSAGRRAAVKAVRAEAETTVRQTVEHIETMYGEYAPKVLAFAIAESVRDKEIGNIATTVLRKIAKGEKASLVDMHNLDAVTETSIAEKAVEGKLPAPQGSAPPEGGQQPKPQKRPISSIRSPNISQGSQMSFVSPTTKAVEYLMANPDTAAQFDRSYGPGAAEMWLPKGR